MKQIEELITNRLPPSAPPAPAVEITPPEVPASLPPLTSRTYERTPTIPSIDKLKGRNNYPTWIINVESHARHLRLWSVIQGQQGTDEQKDLAQSLIILNITMAIQHQIKNLTAAYKLGNT